MRPDEVAPYLERLSARVASSGAKGAANGMAAKFDRGIKTTELRRFTHTAGTRTPSPPGSPPALVTGRLRDSLRIRAARGGIRATASDGPTVVYARIQERGGTIYPRVKKWLHWVDAGGEHFAKKVKLPARPYMRPAAERMSGDGTLARGAEEGFMRAVFHD